MGPQEMPIKAQTTNTVISDGAGMELPISTLPLAEGYKATLYQFDMMTQKQKAIGLAVVSSEKVTIAVKDFDTLESRAYSERRRIRWNKIMDSERWSENY